LNNSEEANKIHFVGTELKYGLLAVVVVAILYVLISPLPEMDAAGSIRLILPSFTFWLCWALSLSVLSVSFRPAWSLSLSIDDIVKKNCARLC
jgi:hypothetical protein